MGGGDFDGLLKSTIISYINIYIFDLCEKFNQSFDLCEKFNQSDLQITEYANTTVVDYLDMTFDIQRKE